MLASVHAPSSAPRAAGDPPSAGHAASLSTTAGITSVITGVLAAAFAGQAPPMATASPAGALAAATVSALVLGALGLYEARNAIGAAMDALPADPARGARLAARALMTYHLGMAGVFAGLAAGAAWRVALPHGAVGWAGAAVAALAAAVAVGRAAGWARRWWS